MLPEKCMNCCQNECRRWYMRFKLRFAYVIHKQQLSQWLRFKKPFSNCLQLNPFQIVYNFLSFRHDSYNPNHSLFVESFEFSLWISSVSNVWHLKVFVHIKNTLLSCMFGRKAGTGMIWIWFNGFINHHTNVDQLDKQTCAQKKEQDNHVKQQILNHDQD